MVDTSTSNLDENKLITRLFDSQPDSVVWFTPVTDATGVVDFEVSYCNAAACRILNASSESVRGARLNSSALMDDDSRKAIFEQCLNVWEKNEPLEFTYYSPGLDKHFNVQRTRLEQGVLSITRDHTDYVKASAERESFTMFLSELIEHSPYGVALYESVRDTNGQITDFKLRICNQKSAEIIGFSMDDIQRYTAKELMILRGQTSFFEVCRRVVEEGRSMTIEYFAVSLNRWLSISIVRFNDGYLLNYVDVTPMKELEIRARDQAQLLNSVLNASITGIYSIEAIRDLTGKVNDFRITMVNESAKRMMGYNEDDLSATYVSLFPSVIDTGLFDMLVEVLTTGKQAEKLITYKEGRYDGEYLVSANRLNEQTVVVSYSDVTEAVRSRRQLEKAVDELTEANLALENITYAASHDLKEPLRKISMFSGLAVQHIDKPEVAAVHLAKVTRATQRMDALLTSILEYNRAGVIPEMNDDCDLGDIFRHCCDDLDHLIHEANARVSHDNLPVIKGNRYQLQQLFTNLLTNAIKFRRGEPVVSVSGYEEQIAGSEDRRFQVVFRDNGIGFDNEHAEKMFLMFERLNRMGQYPGSGVGLALCKRIVENHGGTIRAQGKRNEGAVFTIEFPVR